MARNIRKQVIGLAEARNKLLVDERMVSLAESLANRLTTILLKMFLNPFNWLLGRQFLGDKNAYDMSWVFPKLKNNKSVKWWSVLSSMTIASVGFLSKMFIGELL